MNWRTEKVTQRWIPLPACASPRCSVKFNTNNTAYVHVPVPGCFHIQNVVRLIQGMCVPDENQELFTLTFDDNNDDSNLFISF